jgi:hypothetical protein
MLPRQVGAMRRPVTGSGGAPFIPALRDHRGVIGVTDKLRWRMMLH